MQQLSSASRRLIAALTLSAFLVAGANYQFNLQLFGRYDKLIFVVCFVLLVVVVRFLRPDMPQKRPTFSWTMYLTWTSQPY